MRRGRLQWFDYVRQVGEDSAVKVVENLEVAGRRPLGKPKKTWRLCMQQNLEWLKVKE